jgi:hypothetical protein
MWIFGSVAFIENKLPYLAITLGDDGDKLMNSYYKWV